MVCRLRIKPSGEKRKGSFRSKRKEPFRKSLFKNHIIRKAVLVPVLGRGAPDQRQQVIGVSSDEELTYMIKYQNVYNASSRFINVIDEMIEHLITQLG